MRRPPPISSLQPIPPEEVIFPFFSVETMSTVPLPQPRCKSYFIVIKNVLQSLTSIRFKILTKIETWPMRLPTTTKDLACMCVHLCVCPDSTYLASVTKPLK